VEFRILGPLEVVSGDRVIDLGGAKQRALLAVLLLNANEVVSKDRLLDALWEDDPPETAHKALQVHVSALRKLLGKERVETHPAGYRLRVEHGELDLERFRRLHREGKLPEALALWRGPPLADFAYHRFASAEAARLEELRLGCLEERIERDLRAGRHPELVGELEALVDRHPLRERLRGQLMRALYGAGRQADALRVYQEARRALVDELGIEPSRELRDLHQAILRQDPGLEPAEPRAPEARADERRAFVGREPELAQLRAGLDEAFAGRGCLFLLQGEPGIGKSALADELAGEAGRRGASVLVGRCWEAGGAPAYWPWTQSLRAYLRRADPGAVRRQLGAHAPEIAQIVPELREHFPGLPASEAVESEAGRFRLFDAAASVLRTIAAVRPVALVLDDLQAADEPSLLLLRYVASTLADSRILVVGTFRDLDPTVRDPLESTLAELSREPVTRRIRLGGLSEPEVGRLAELTADAAPSTELVASLYAETEGNPLFVSETVRLLAAEGRLTGAAPSSIPVPSTIREVIGRRLRSLSGECRRILSLASVLGREFGLVALERVADYTGIDTLLGVLDEAIRARVVEEIPGAVGRLRFGHALTRDVLYDEIPATHRARLHRRVAEVLETLYAGNTDPHLAELAHHYALAVPAAAPATAVDYARRAGEQAARLLAYEEAARLYALTLDIAESQGALTEPERCDLILRLGDLQARAGDLPAAKASFLRAAEVARGARLPDRLARAALGYGGRFVWARSWDDTTLIPLLEEALAALSTDDSELRVRLLARLAGGPLRDVASPATRVAMSQEALDMARRIGDPATLAYALNGRYSANWAPGALAERLALADELIRVAGEAEDVERVYEGYDSRAWALLEAGDLAAVGEAQAIKKRLAHELRQPAQLWDVAISDANLALFAGRFEEAESLIESARGLGRLVASQNAQVGFELQRYGLRRAQCRLEEIVDAVRGAVDAYPQYPLWSYVLADVYAELGRETEARALLDRLAADGFRVQLEMQWLFSLSLLPEVCRYLGDRDRAGMLYERLAPYAHHNAVAPPELCTGSVSRSLGILAATIGRADDAERHFQDAVDMNGRMGARPWLAHAQSDYAQLLLARSAPGDRRRARALLDEAIAIYGELRMPAYEARAAAAGEA